MSHDKAIFRLEGKNGEHVSAARRFLSTHGSPMTHIPHLADFFAHCIDHQQPPSTASFIQYAAEHPGTLPTAELTGTIDDEPSDVDYRYFLTFAANSHGLTLSILADPRWLRKMLIPETITPATLFDVAARMCDLMAQTVNSRRPWETKAAQHREHHAYTSASGGKNFAAQHFYADFDAPHPAIRVAGVFVFAYIDGDGRLQVSVDLDDSDTQLNRTDGTVPMQITVQGQDVFTG